MPVSFEQTINPAGLFPNGAGGAGGGGNDDGGDDYLPRLPSAVSSVMYWKKVEHELNSALYSEDNENDQLDIEIAQEQLSLLNHQIFGESVDASDEHIASYIQSLEYANYAGFDEERTESDEPVAEVLYTDLFGKTRVLSDVPLSTRISHVKVLIEKQTKIPPASQCLSIGGKRVLEDDRLLLDYNTDSTCNINLWLRLVGGVPQTYSVNLNPGEKVGFTLQKDDSSGQYKVVDVASDCVDIQVGDVLLSVNGLDITDFPQSIIQKMVHQDQVPRSLTVQRIFDPLSSSCTTPGRASQKRREGAITSHLIRTCNPDPRHVLLLCLTNHFPALTFTFLLGLHNKKLAKLPLISWHLN